MDSWTCSPSTHESMFLCLVEFQQSTSRPNGKQRPCPCFVLKEGDNIPASLEELDIAFRCTIAPSSPNEGINKPISPPIYSFPLTKSPNFRSVTKMNPEKLKNWIPGNRFSSLNKWKELKSHGFVLTAKKFKEPTAAYEALQMEGSRRKRRKAVSLSGQRERSQRTDKTFSGVTSCPQVWSPVWWEIEAEPRDHQSGQRVLLFSRFTKPRAYRYLCFF